MIIDCATCTVRGDACAECVVTFLTIPVGAPAVPGHPTRRATPCELDDAEQEAIGVLARCGLVPPLRLAGTG